MNTKTALIAIAALLTAACSQMEYPVQEGTPVTLKYTTIDATETKAAQNLNEGTFASGESIKVRISNTGAGSWTDYDFTTGDAGAMSPTSTVPYYPAGSQNIDIVAYYPATAGTSFSVATDQIADANYKASDLMFASVTNQAKQATAVELAFAHKMTKMNVNITAGTGVTSITSVSILNVKPTVSFDQATGVVGSASGSATSIAMSNNGAAIIPAQTIDGNLLSIVTNKGTAIYSVSNKAFEAGKQYTLNITVNLRAVNSTTVITGWTSEGTVIVNPVQGNSPDLAEAVDLGLSVKWANMNVGATAETDYGTYFAWGEISGLTVTGHSGTIADGNAKTYFSWHTYAWANIVGEKYSLSKYCPTAKQGTCWFDPEGSMVPADNITKLLPCDDAARANWGGDWRMPTLAEIAELMEETNNEWVADYNGTGVSGYKFTKKNDATKFIFLPAAGQRSAGVFYNQGTFGYYWSSNLFEPDPYFASELYFQSEAKGSSENMRFYGFPVRPVK